MQQVIKLLGRAQLLKLLVQLPCCVMVMIRHFAVSCVAVPPLQKLHLAVNDCKASMFRASSRLLLFPISSPSDCWGMYNLKHNWKLKTFLVASNL